MSKKFAEGDWIRTCQECGMRQRTPRPNSGKELTDAYCNRPCRACRSPALDYGREWQPPEEE